MANSMERRRYDSESGRKSTIDYVFFVAGVPVGVAEIKKVIPKKY